MSKKRIVCFANSRKPRGRCIAGKEIIEHDVKEWIRPVSARKGEEVSSRERQYDGGIEPRLLDIVDISFLQHVPKNHQIENWLLNPGMRWEKVDSISWNDLYRFVDVQDSLWINGSSTIDGLNDKIQPFQVNLLQSSLRLIYVEKLTLVVLRQLQRNGRYRNRLQARFFYCNAEYWLWVTDIDYENTYKLPDQEYQLDECFLTISIGDIFGDGSCYKLVAAIIERNIGRQTR